MKKNNVEIIKADSLVRRRGDNVERHLKRVAVIAELVPIVRIRKTVMILK